MKNLNSSRILLLCWIALLLAPTTAFAGEGFGWPKKTTVDLQRRRPADVFIAGTRIAVRPSGQGGDAERQLASWLESEMRRNDRRLEVADPPETLVMVEVLQNDYNENWENRTETRTYDAGKDSKGKTIWREKEVTVRYKVVHYLLNVSYKVTDNRRGASLDANNFSHQYKKDFAEGEGAPERSTLVSDGVASISRSIARRLTPTLEPIQILLPAGSLKDLGRLATAGLWDRYLESLEQLPVRPKREDEAYRQFALGIAYEALGYKAEDTDTALRYFEQASTHYNAAIEANPKEKYFSRPYDGGFMGSSQVMAPFERVRSSLVQYQQLAEHQQLAQQTGGAGVGSTTGSKSTLGEPAPDAMNNRAVIEMSQAGLAEDVILTAVDSAPSTAFDVTPAGLIELARGKVSQRIIQRLQALANPSVAKKP